MTTRVGDCLTSSAVGGYDHSAITCVSAESMANGQAPSESVRTAIFAGSLTLIAILVGVVGILGGEIARMVSRGSPELVWRETWLLWGVVALIALNAWCAIISLVSLARPQTPACLYTWPMYGQPAIVFVGVLIWSIWMAT